MALRSLANIIRWWGVCCEISLARALVGTARAAAAAADDEIFFTIALVRCCRAGAPASFALWNFFEPAPQWCSDPTGAVAKFYARQLCRHDITHGSLRSIDNCLGRLFHHLLLRDNEVASCREDGLETGGSDVRVNADTPEALGLAAC